METEKLIATRHATHGVYRHVCELDQATQKAWRNSQNWEHLTDVQRCSLQMISHKIARILSGDPFFDDHWKDCSTYAELARRSLEEEKP